MPSVSRLFPGTRPCPLDPIIRSATGHAAARGHTSQSVLTFVPRLGPSVAGPGSDTFRTVRQLTRYALYSVGIVTDRHNSEARPRGRTTGPRRTPTCRCWHFDPQLCGSSGESPDRPELMTSLRPSFVRRASMAPRPCWCSVTMAFTVHPASCSLRSCSSSSIDQGSPCRGGRAASVRAFACRSTQAARSPRRDLLTGRWQEPRLPGGGRLPRLRWPDRPRRRGWW